MRHSLGSVSFTIYHTDYFFFFLEKFFGSVEKKKLGHTDTGVCCGVIPGNFFFSTTFFRSVGNWDKKKMCCHAKSVYRASGVV